MRTYTKPWARRYLSSKIQSYKRTTGVLLFVQPSGNTLHGGYICDTIIGYKWQNEIIYIGRSTQEHTAKVKTAAATLKNGADRSTASTATWNYIFAGIPYFSPSWIFQRNLMSPDCQHRRRYCQLLTKERNLTCIIETHKQRKACDTYVHSLFKMFFLSIFQLPQCTGFLFFKKGTAIRNA